MVNGLGTELVSWKITGTPPKFHWKIPGFPPDCPVKPVHGRGRVYHNDLESRSVAEAQAPQRFLQISNEPALKLIESWGSWGLDPTPHINIHYLHVYICIYICVKI